MAEFVVSFVVERLGDLLIQKATLLYSNLHGVKKQVEHIRVELRQMQCFMKDADKRQDEDDSLRNWVSEIREVAYDAEDVIETFAIKVMITPIPNPLKRYACFFNQASRLDKVGSEIKAINARISDLSRSAQTYGLNAVRDQQGSSSLAIERQRQLRWSYSHIVDDHIVGLQGNITELVAELVNEEKHGRVVSICGMGGLGKTTLAKEVYRDDHIRRYFDGSAWAYISQQCKPRDVWEGILIKLTSPSKEERDHIVRLRDEELAKKLYHVQQEKKYLVVLDDIWSIEAWEILSPAFPSSGNGCSRILLTTRNKELASYVDPRGLLHEPRNFSEEEGWELLQRKAFPRTNDPDFSVCKDKEKLGREMVKRCAGLPLAIVVLGGLLATKETVHEWEIMHRDILSYLKQAKGHQFPPNLAKLTLWGSKLEEDPMPTLEKLPNLRMLSGWQMFTGKKMVCSNKGFPKLKSLLLRGFSNFEDWIMEEGAMPSLCRLEVSNCIKLKTIPDALRFVKTLQELEIHGCLFKVNIGIEGSDFYKVQHVPSIVIRN